MAKDNTTKYIILGLLCHEPLTGYDIKKKIEHGISYFWSDVSFGQIYPTLSKLEKEGLATKQVEFHEDGPTRKIYTITEKGKAVFRQWLAIPVKKEQAKYEIALKLFFGSQLPVDENLKKLQAFRERTIQKIATMEQYEENLRMNLGQSEDHLYFLLVVLFGKHFYTASINWIDEAVQILENFKQGENLS